MKTFAEILKETTNAPNLNESAVSIKQMSNGQFIITNKDNIYVPSPQKGKKGSWVASTAFVHSGDWDGVKFKTKKDAQAECDKYLLNEQL